VQKTKCDWIEVTDRIDIGKYPGSWIGVQLPQPAQPTVFALTMLALIHDPSSETEQVVDVCYWSSARRRHLVGRLLLPQ
jgi:hypothetical protein